MTIRQLIGGSLTLIAAGLLAINTFGLVAEPYERPQSAKSYTTTLDRMDRAIDTSSAVDYQVLSDITEAYADGIDYMWPEERAQVALTDNWILHLMAYLDGPLHYLGLTSAENLFSAYETINYERALRRGYGICSQNALGLVSILDQRYGIDADVILLQGHVVVESRSKLLDPSVGVSLPFSLEEAEKLQSNSDEISSIYGEKPGDYSHLGETYDAAGNRRFDGASNYRPRLYWFEIFSNYLKWLIPVVLFLIAAWVAFGNRPRSDNY